METAEVCQIDVATRRIVEGNDSPTEQDSHFEEEVAEFGFELCCNEEERGETPGREDSPSDLREAELDPGGELKSAEDDAFDELQTANGVDASDFRKEVVLLMQALNSLATPEEKLAALCKKYADLEENAQRSREYEEQRKEAMLHFQMTLSDIEVQMEQHSSHNTKLRQENMELAEKLKKLIEQYELREEHIDRVFKHKELQQQLMDAKLQRITEMMKEVEEKQLRERNFLLKDATDSRHKVDMMKEQEVHLKQQLSLYMDKFEEFQSTLAKSNDVFTTFRQEMEKMTKKIKKLEKETTQWRTKWESNNQTLLQMAEEKTLRDGHFKALQGKLELLERLCRALQKERNDLNNQVSLLQEQGNEPPELAGEGDEGKDDKLAHDERLDTKGFNKAPRPPEMAVESKTASKLSSQPIETKATQD
ncbi:gamma-taxilin isoform X3 [Vanacampus margaritifer]